MRNLNQLRILAAVALFMSVGLLSACGKDSEPNTSVVEVPQPEAPLSNQCFQNGQPMYGQHTTQPNLGPNSGWNQNGNGWNEGGRFQSGQPRNVVDVPRPNDQFYRPYQFNAQQGCPIGYLPSAYPESGCMTCIRANDIRDLQPAYYRWNQNDLSYQFSWYGTPSHRPTFYAQQFYRTPNFYFQYQFSASSTYYYPTQVTQLCDVNNRHSCGGYGYCQPISRNHNSGICARY